MNKTISICTIFLLLNTPAWSQMGGGMMGGGMMSGGMMNGGQNEAARSATSGAGIFNANCASCHGDGGNSVVPSLPISGSRMLVDHKTFEDFIRHPRMPDGSTGAMPAFAASQISDLQLKSLYPFIVAKFGSGTPKR